MILDNFFMKYEGGNPARKNYPSSKTPALLGLMSSKLVLKESLRKLK